MIVRSTFAKVVALALLGSAACVPAHSQTSAPSSAAAPTAQDQAPATVPAATAQAPEAAIPTSPAKGKRGKVVYTGPNTVVVLPPTPMLDREDKQRVDPA